jgi:hypothetical protein
MKHIKTQQQLNEAQENLNISDVISRLEYIYDERFFVQAYGPATKTRIKSITGDCVDAELINELIKSLKK